MRKLIFFLNFIFIIFNISCSNHKQDQGSTKENKQDQVVFIFEPNKIDWSSKRLKHNTFMLFDSDSLQLKNHYVNNYLKSDTIILNLKGEGQYFNYYLNNGSDIKANIFFSFHKGDTVDIKYRDNKPLISLRNSDLEVNGIDYQLTSLDKRPLENYEFRAVYNRERSTDEIKSYVQDLDKYYKDLYSTLDSLKEERRLSNVIYDVLYFDNYFYRININKENYDFNIVKENDLKHDNLLVLGTYRYFLENYIQYHYKIRIPDPMIPFEIDYKQAFQKVIVATEFSETIKNYLLIYYFEQMVRNGIVNSDLQTLYKQLEFNVTNYKAISYIKNKYSDRLKLVDTKEAFLLDSNGNIISLVDLVKEKKGKVLIVDFWASWCGPCLQMMPYSKELKQSYKNKDVEFIYISIDSDKTAWSITSQRIGLSLGRENLLTINYPEASFYKELNLIEIPRYIIYDKTGKLINPRAPYPNSEALRTEIQNKIILLLILYIIKNCFLIFLYQNSVS